MKHSSSALSLMIINIVFPSNVMVLLYLGDSSFVEMIDNNRIMDNNFTDAASHLENTLYSII